MAELGIPDFETPHDCAKRQEKMVTRLAARAKGRVLQRLAQCMASECDSEPCSGACHFAMRRHRLALIPAAHDLFQKRGRKHQVNIVHPSWRKRYKHLNRASPETAKQWVRRRLEKLDGKILAVGSFEVTLNVELDGTRHWAGEIVMIVAGATKRELKRVLELRPADKKRLQPQAKPMQILRVRDLGRQLGYANKRISSNGSPISTGKIARIGVTCRWLERIRMQ